MIELRSFEGDADELQRFVVGIWRTTYAGRMPIILWTAPYFDWQLGLNEGLPRDHLVAAYDAGRLVGTVLGIPYQFHLLGEEFSGTLGSWLSVDPEYRRTGLGSQLRAEMVRQHLVNQLEGQLGYIYEGSRSALGNPFWKGKSKQGSQALRKIGHWVRVLDPRRAAAWNYHRFEAWVTRLAAPLIIRPRCTSHGAVRSYRSDDLAICVELANQTSRETDLGILWTPHTLGRLLDGKGVGRALVYEKDQSVGGFCAYHVLPFLGRTEEPVGIIDLCMTSGLSSREAASLLNHALHDIQEAGGILAMKLRSGDVPASLAWRCGFVPSSADSRPCLTWVNPSREIGSVGRMHLVWR